MLSQSRSQPLARGIMGTVDTAIEEGDLLVALGYLSSSAV